MDWLRILFGPDDGNLTVGQACVRALLLFVYGVICIRVAGRRTFSRLSPLDILVAIVVGSNVSRVMLGKVPVISSLAATMVVVVSHRLLAMATIRSNLLASWIKGRPQVLARHGLIDQAAMLRNNFSADDLTEALRMQKVERVEDTSLVTFERGGTISVIPKKPET